MPFSYQGAGQTRSGPRFDHGIVRWDDAPGLGVTVDEDVLGSPVFQLTR
jgi:hypothetical protein